MRDNDDALDDIRRAKMKFSLAIEQTMAEFLIPAARHPRPEVYPAVVIYATKTLSAQLGAALGTLDELAKAHPEIADQIAEQIKSSRATLEAAMARVKARR